MTVIGRSTPAITLPSHPAAAFSHFLARLTAIVAIVAGASHFFGLMAPLSLFWVIGAIVLMLIGAFVAGMVALRDIWREGGTGLGHLARGLIWALPVIMVLIVGAVHIVTNPPLTEISTDPVEPPRFLPQQDEPLSLPALQAQIAAWPDLTGRRYASSPEEVEAALREVIADSGWLFRGQFGTLATNGELTLLVEGRAGILLLPTRIAVRITEEGETSYVDMRSRTLAGAHDMGGNGAVITKLFDALTEKLQITIQN
ncbi:DUF1499 domain-containing protein [Notoacmeibacter sp. MSK16QG-6]|uniref:DUF1499 domain-containing protein n=1 Tax=Notoacmeibacter sp. MSK16QG-6 TaxID=2957982 RepID=UPI0020A177D0|nr:DUF1499 domain-containing protein [Notoacmeibacter sp. MSK16QG-6]MCP1198200.1 DUF1499 domain-containing protein [Notoacmeibacter sp. MSK16QG-6]